MLKVLHLVQLAVLAYILSLNRIKCTDNTSTSAITQSDLETEYKHLLLFMTEPFIAGASINGKAIEGSQVSDIAKYMTSQIKSVIAEAPRDINLERLKSFLSSLEKGVSISKDIDLPIKEMDKLSSASSIQEDLLEFLDNSDSWIYVPITWKGKEPHAIVLGFQKNADGTFNLAVINTGLGIEYHLSIQDPNGGYAMIYQLWMEFKNIPKEEIFDEAAWFIKAIILLNDCSFISNFEPVQLYFYGTILSNFKKYLDKPKEPLNKKLFMTGQRSGSCSVSSMLAALLHNCQDKAQFYLYRLLLAQKISAEFLKKSTHLGFPGLINDGFDIFGRKIFKSVASSLANFASQYLEEAHGDHFKNAILLGTGKGKWLKTKKSGAFELLQKSSISLELLKSVVELGTKFFQTLQAHQIDPQSNHLEFNKTGLETVKSNRHELQALYVDQFLLPTSNTPYSYLSSNILRPSHLLRIEDLSLRLIECAKSKTINVFTCSLDAFNRAGPAWWLKIDAISGKHSAKALLSNIREVTESCALFQGRKRSLDELLLTASLQLAIWRAAKVFDKLSGNTLGLSHFSPPIAIQKHIENSIFLSGLSFRWKIMSNFDAANLESLKQVYSELNASSGAPRFAGPHELLQNPKTYTIGFDKFSKLDQANREVYQKLQGIKQVKAIIKSILDDPKNVKIKYDQNGPIAVLFTEIDHLSDIVPQFYELLKVNLYIYSLLTPGIAKKLEIGASYEKLDSIEIVNTNDDFSSLTSETRYDFVSSNSYDCNLPVPSEIYFDKNLKSENLFITACHSSAFEGSANIINFETWLNNVKGALDSEIFADSHFMYITNRLLNVPKIVLGDDDQISLSPSDTYPAGFEVRHIFEIYDALSGLIQGDLGKIISRPVYMDRSQVNNLVQKAATMGLILSAFIERVDHDKMVSGTTASKMLAKLYMQFLPLSQFKNNNFDLSDMDTSVINLVLAHICSFNLRNAREFYENIVLESVDTKFVPSFRQSMARIHYFLSILNFEENLTSIKGTRTSTKKKYDVYSKYTKASLVEDLYQQGFLFHPIDKIEEEFTTEILKSIFLSNYAPNSQFDNFKYAKDGDLVEMKSTDNMTISIQLSSGRMAVNNIPIASKNIILTAYTFRKLFPTSEDRFHASKGEAFRMGQNTVYLLKNFRNRGINFFFARDDASSSTDITAFRQWNEQWYLYRDTDQMGLYLSFLEITPERNPYHSYSLYQKVIIKMDDFEYDGEICAEEVKYQEQLLLNLSSDQVPLFYSKFKYYYANDDWPVNLKIGHFDMECNFVKYGQRVKKPLYLSKHINSFVSENILSYCMKDSGEFVFILPTFQFHQDQTLPIVLAENSQGELDILNLAGYVVESLQTINENIGLKGTLRVRNKDGERFLMVPLSPRNVFEFSGTHPKKVNIEFIPILNGSVAPQTRFHRLLLAYYMAESFEFDFSRKLLHPIVSIHQNEVFSFEELSILSWFSRILNSTPEMTALKVFTYFHFYINRQRFPLEYSTGGSKFSNEHSTVITQMTGRIKDTMFSYLLSVRDLSDKFNMLKVFSELRDQDIFDKIYGKIASSSTQLMAEKSIKTNLDNACKSIFQLKHYKQKVSWDLQSQYFFADSKLDLEAFYETFQISNSPNMAKLKFLARIGRKVILKDNELFRNTFSTEMAYYCLVKDPKMWQSFGNSINTKFQQNHGGNLKPDQITNLATEFKEIVGKCEKKYSDDFDVANQAKIFEIDLKLIHDSLLDNNSNTDAKADIDRLEGQVEFKIVDVADLKHFNDLSDALKGFKRNAVIPSSSLKDYFDYLSESKVLKKLSKSMNDFVLENGEANTNILNVAEYPDLLGLIQGFNAYVEGRIDQLNESLRDMAQDLTATTSLADDSSLTASNVFDYISQLAHGKKSKTFSSLFLCYQNGSLDCFQKKFPGLSVEDCKKLFVKTAQFYSTSVLVQYFSFVLSKTEDLVLPKNHITSAEIITILLDELSKINDFNARVGNQTILNFEFRSEKYRLKPEQVADVALLTSRDPVTGLFKSAVIQRMMAAGKTLVLGTISIVRKAIRGDTLSILVPPASLYQSNTSAMQIRTYSYFKRKGTTFHFPRFQLSGVDEFRGQIEFMSFVCKLIRNTMKERNYMILSPDTLHAFLNSYIESLNLFVSAETFNAKNLEVLQMFAEIYSVFREKSSIILDEIDMTLDPRKELNFPTTEREPYNMSAAILTTDLLEFAIFDTKVLEAGLDIHGNNQSKLSKAQIGAIKGLFLEYIKSQLQGEISLWHAIIFTAATKAGLALLTVDKIMEFLREEDMSFGVSWIKAVGECGDQTIANALIILKAQIHGNLFESFKSSANLNYGLPGLNRSDKHYAVPYLAANTPSPSSEFADRWETLNKTLLTFAATSCTMSVAESIIRYVSETIAKESSESVQPFSTSGYKNISALLPTDINPLALKEDNAQDVALIHDFLKSRSPAAVRILFSYCVDVVFAGMDFATEQVTSNALNMTSMFGSIQGYSGTIDNVNILPQAVIEDAYADHLLNEKNNGGIALKLLKDSSSSEGSSLVPELSDREFSPDAKVFVQTILGKFTTHSPLSAIIDAGAFFKNFDNLQVARAILDLKSPDIKAVLYYNEKSNQLEFVRKSEGNYVEGFLATTDPDSISKTTQTQLAERFTFYDHRHITGSDILQPRQAHAILTVGTRILLRDILQGTLRMRQFMTSQVVHFVTSVAAKQFYYSKVEPTLPMAEVSKRHVKVSDMLALGALNEDEKQLFENEKLAFVKIDNEIRRFVLDEISLLIGSGAVGATIKGLTSIWFQKNRHLFIRLIRESPLQWLRRQEHMDSQSVLASFVEARLLIVREIIAQVQEEYRKLPAGVGKIDDRFRAMEGTLKAMTAEDKTKAGSLLHFLKDTMKTRTDDSQSSEVEMQLDVNILVDLNLDVLIQTFDTLPSMKKHQRFTLTAIDTDDTSCKSVVSLESVLQDPKMDDMYRTYTETAILTSGKQVAVSMDLVDLVNDTKPRPFKIFSFYTRAASHLLVQVSQNKTIRVFLLSLEAAKSVYSELAGDGEKAPLLLNSTFWLCDLAGRVSITNDTHSKAGMNVLDFIPASRLLIFDALIFNGSMSQIISSEHLNGPLYMNYWLKNPEEYIKRATFLLLRMKVLFDKTYNCMERTNAQLILLEKLARGDASALDSAIKLENQSSNSSNYQKEPICPEDEARICRDRSIRKESTVARDDSDKQAHSSGLNIQTVFNAVFGKIGTDTSTEDLHPEFGLQRGGLLGPDANVDSSKDSFTALQKSLSNEAAMSHWKSLPGCPEEVDYPFRPSGFGKYSPPPPPKPKPSPKHDSDDSASTSNSNSQSSTDKKHFELGNKNSSSIVLVTIGGLGILSVVIIVVYSMKKRRNEAIED